ncbi:type II toxin-antitoxin system HicB family antitoxin [Halorubrum tibetense]|uniref:Type II toxin-antitoxin system HicB family antitoxin n=1 Tax=Halorubrum tibetense TaxID=175631 RepID=A0ABD5SBC1_9EURY
MDMITIEREDDWFVITDEETGVTTQGETKLEALLMLADVLAGYEDADEDLLATALDVFVPDPETEELAAGLSGDEYDPPDVSEDEVARQREAALWLAKSHKSTNYSDPHRFGTLRAFIYGQTHNIPFSQLGDLVTNGYWAVFDAIATGTRNKAGLTEQLGVDEGFITDAVQGLKIQELIAEATDGSLYAAQRAVGVGPYVIEDEYVINWREDYDHTLARDLSDDELPVSVDDGVFVERMGTGYGWYHDPESYKPPVADEVVMTREEAEESNANPCPRCFPKSEYEKKFNVTDLGGGTTKYVPKSSDGAIEEEEGSGE